MTRRYAALIAFVLISGFVLCCSVQAQTPLAPPPTPDTEGDPNAPADDAALIAECIKTLESGGNYDAVNADGYGGLAGFGVSAMMTHGYCQLPCFMTGGSQPCTQIGNIAGCAPPGQFTYYDTFNNCRNDAQGSSTILQHWEDCVWTQAAADASGGTLAAGTHGSLSQMLSNEGLQDAAFADQMQWTLNNAQSLVDQYPDLVINGVPMTAPVVQYMLNFGPAATQSYLSSNGAINICDGYFNTEHGFADDLCMDDIAQKMYDCLLGLGIC